MDFTVLRNTRKQLKLKQEEVAKASDISQPYLSLIELNQRQPSVKDVESICTILGLELVIIHRT